MNTGFGVITIPVGPLETNCYLVTDPLTLATFIIDPGGEAERLIAEINKNKLKPAMIVNTHGHADHTGAVDVIRKAFGIKLYVHAKEAEFIKDPYFNGSGMLPDSMHSSSSADVLVEDGALLKAGNLVFKVIHTPGHTPGGICLAAPGAIFTGDTLFRGDIGRSDLPGGDEAALMRSLKLFSNYPPETKIYPGHGPESTLEREFRDNPYLT